MTRQLETLYSFVPAALFPKTHCSTGIYVKYHSYKNIPITLKLYTSLYTWLDTPDRELLVVNDAATTSACRPLDENYDEFIALSPFHLTANDHTPKWGMTNYIQNINEQYNHNMMDSYSQMPKGKRKFMCLSDSGGFQLGRGNISFIDPEKLATWYHHNSDVGMALDIPIGSRGSRYLLPQAAAVQKQNNKIMLKTLQDLNSKTEIMNVVHGLTIEEQKTYHEMVYEPSLHRFSMAGIYHTTVVDAVRGVRAFLFNKDIAKQYDHVHLLGIFNNKLLPALIWMARQYNEEYGKGHLFTSDVSTAIQQSIAKTYLLLSEYDESYKYQQLGTSHQFGHKASRLLQSSHRTLNCCCPVCSTVKYTDIFTFFTGRALTDLLICHNIYAMDKYTRYVQDMAQLLNFRDYTDLIRRHVGKRAKRDTVDALHFLNYAQHHGNKAAEKHYSLYFPEKTSSKYIGSLFGVEKQAPLNSAQDDKVKAAINRYVKYFKTGKAPKTLKIILEKRTGSQAYKSKSRGGTQKLKIRKPK